MVFGGGATPDLPPQTLPPIRPSPLPAAGELRGVTLNQSVAASYVGRHPAGTHRGCSGPVFAASLNRLHRGMGTGLPLATGDLAALAMLLLALTSLLMWNKLHGPPAAASPCCCWAPLTTVLVALL